MSIFQFFTDGARKNRSMQEIYNLAERNLDVLEPVLLITLLFFIFALLIWIFYFKLNKALPCRRAISIFFLTLVGIGWLMTGYNYFIFHTTTTVLATICVTLLIMNLYLLHLYFLDPFSPGKPLQHAHKIYLQVMIAVIPFNLALLSVAALAQGAVMTQAFLAEAIVEQALEMAKQRGE